MENLNKIDLTIGKKYSNNIALSFVMMKKLTGKVFLIASIYQTLKS
jgi:hypothetical protein